MNNFQYYFRPENIKNCMRYIILITGIIVLTFSCKTLSPAVKEKITSTDVPVSAVFITAKADYINPLSKDINLNIESFDPGIKDNSSVKVKNWSVTFKNNQDATIDSVNNTGDLKGLSWNGKLADNSIVPDGNYYAVLAVNFEPGGQSNAKSKTFIIDTKQPYLNVSTMPDLFSPDNEVEENNKLHISVDAKALSGIKDWKVTILTPDSSGDFMIWSGKGQPPADLIWDGIGTKGKMVASAEDYPLKVFVENNVGSQIEKIFPSVKIALLVNKLTDGRLKIQIGDVLFVPDSTDFSDTSADMNIMNTLAKNLKKFDKYKIIIEGHVNPYTKERFIEKIADVLSKNRANVIARILEKNGLKKDRISTIGRGGKSPVVAPPDGNIKVDKNYYEENRRGDFYLNK